MIGENIMSALMPRTLLLIAFEDSDVSLILYLRIQKVEIALSEQS